jgi:lysozyme family protein
MAEFNTACDIVLRNEGGLLHDKSDPGGITNFGISLRFLKTIKPDATADDIINMTVDHAKQIYHDHFWLAAPFFSIVNQPIANYVFDMAVNMGLGNATKVLQRALQRAVQIKDDGVWGMDTQLKLNACCSGLLLAELRKARIAYYERCVADNPFLARYLSGWIKRANEDFGAL